MLSWTRAWRGQRARDGDRAADLALRERGIIVRVSAGTLVVVNSVLLAIAVTRTDSVGLTVAGALALGVPHLLVEAVIAAMPWQRLLPVRPRPWT